MTALAATPVRLRCAEVPMGSQKPWLSGHSVKRTEMVCVPRLRAQAARANGKAAARALQFCCVAAEVAAGLANNNENASAAGGRNAEGYDRERSEPLESLK